MAIAVEYNVTACNLLGICRLCSSVNFYQTIQRYIPRDSSLYGNILIGMVKGYSLLLEIFFLVGFLNVGTPLYAVINQISSADTTIRLILSF
jgi:hypothetical protein